MNGRKSKRSGSFQFLTELCFFLVIYFAISKYSDYNLSFTNLWINSDEEVLGCEPLLPDSSRFYRRHHYTTKQGRSQGGSWAARDPPFCKPFLPKQPTAGGKNAMTISWP